MSGDNVNHIGIAGSGRRLTRRCLLAVMLSFGSSGFLNCGARLDEPRDAGAAGASVASGGAWAAGGVSGSGGLVQELGGVTGRATGTGGSPIQKGTRVCSSITDDSGSQPALTLFSIRFLATECIVAGDTRNAVDACLAGLNTSWQNGLGILLDCSPCDVVGQYFLNLLAVCSQLGDNYDPCLIGKYPC